MRSKPGRRFGGGRTIVRGPGIQDGCGCSRSRYWSRWSRGFWEPFAVSSSGMESVEQSFGIGGTHVYLTLSHTLYTIADLYTPDTITHRHQLDSLTLSSSSPPTTRPRTVHAIENSVLVIASLSFSSDVGNSGKTVWGTVKRSCSAVRSYYKVANLLWKHYRFSRTRFRKWVGVH